MVILIVKKWNNAICSNMDGPRDCHTEWSKSDRERNTIWYHLYVESEKVIQMNLSTKQKESYRSRKQTYGYQGVRGGGINWKIGIDINTLLYIK